MTTWLGDGFCDDLANVMECCFDDGDCCGPDVDTKYCTNCSCLETNETISTTEGITYLACYTNYWLTHTLLQRTLYSKGTLCFSRA